MEEAEELADRIAILDKGSIIVEGTLHELKSMLPEGVMELMFLNKQDLEQAVHVLKNYKSMKHDDKNMLTVYTDGTVYTVINILQILQQEEIEIQDFQRKIPSLEDIFLTLIDEKEEI